MNKHVDNGGDSQDLVAEDGDVRTQVPLDEGGGTDPKQAVAGGDVTKGNRGGDDVQATVDAEAAVADDDLGGGDVQDQSIGEADVIKNNTGGDEIHVQGDEILDNEDGDGGAVNAPVEAGVDVAKVEKGGGVVPIPADVEAAGLGMMMTKPERFAHGGECGIAKSAMAAPFFLVTNVTSTRLTLPAELEVTTLDSIILIIIVIPFQSILYLINPSWMSLRGLPFKLNKSTKYPEIWI